MIKRALISMTAFACMMSVSVAANMKPDMKKNFSLGEGTWNGQLKKNGPMIKKTFDQIGYIVSDNFHPNRFTLHHVNGTTRKISFGFNPNSPTLASDLSTWNDCKTSTLLKPNNNSCELSGWGIPEYKNNERIINMVGSVTNIKN